MAMGQRGMYLAVSSFLVDFGVTDIVPDAGAFRDA